MKHAALRTLLCLAAFTLAVPMARADDYAEVGALLRQGRADEALAKADAYIAAKPRDPQMRFMRGVILAEQGKADEATSALTQLTQDYPELPEPHNNLAALHAARGEFDKARSALEMAIRLKPDYATAHENLGDVYARLAGQSYQRAQQLEAGSKSVPPKLALVRQLFSAAPGVSPAPATVAPPRRTVGR